jgi:hypothetical protein
MLSEVALETFQFSVLDCPVMIDAGLELNEAMTGTGSGCVVAWTPPESADVLPAGSWALTT